MADRRNLERLQRATGSQPDIHAAPTVDALMGMVVALLGEVSVLRDRVDAGERLAHAHGFYGPADVDRFQPDAAAITARDRRRTASFDRVLGVARDRLLPEALQQEQNAYEQVIEEVAAR